MKFILRLVTSRPNREQWEMAKKKATLNIVTWPNKRETAPSEEVGVHSTVEHMHASPTYHRALSTWRHFLAEDSATGQRYICTKMSIYIIYMSDNYIKLPSRERSPGGGEGFVKYLMICSGSSSAVCDSRRKAISQTNFFVIPATFVKRSRGQEEEDILYM